VPAVGSAARFKYVAKYKPPMDFIKIRGARQHNRQNIDIDIPRNQMIVVTGLSGSGKSTLAFDTLYAEGQRRYVESLSVYARQFLERMQKPDVDLIEGLSPAIAIEQKAAGHNPRSTVGTVTEIHDYLRLLFARAGTAYCYKCGRPIAYQSVDQMVDKVGGYPTGSKIIVLAPLIQNQTGSPAELINKLKRDGYARLRINGTIFEIEHLPAHFKKESYTIEVVVDRLVQKNSFRNRLADSLELALSLADGRALIELHDPDAGIAPMNLSFSEKAECTTCGISYPKFEPANFSFNSPHGACPECDGLGTRAIIDPELLVPNAELSLREGAVTPWANRSSMVFIEFLEAFTALYHTDIYTPFKHLPEAFQHALFFGSRDATLQPPVAPGESRLGGKKKSYQGLIPQLERQYHETESPQVREEIQKYMAFRPCPACLGARLKVESRAVKIDRLAIHEITGLSITAALAFFRNLKLDGQSALIADQIIYKIKERLEFLEDVGLPYLTLDRAAHTLSGGESQRIRLATQIGARLTGVLYVLDEPSIGLHARDNEKLLQTLTKMRDLGNTVLVVEHDRETIMSANYVIDMGPGAGVQGGRIMFAGTPQDLVCSENSLTGRYLSGRLKIPVPVQRRPVGHKRLTLTNARCNNLKRITIDFPLECLVCVTGVSGSGKSSLVIETLYKALGSRLYQNRMISGTYDQINGLEYIDRVINIDQSPIGKTPRSNPGTYTGAFNYIRDLFSKIPEARMRGYKPGRFSFNVKGGRCESCAGDGIIKIEMHFLPDIYIPCDVCHGKRYNRETLEIRYKGKNIADVLDMTVNQALSYFERLGGPVRQILQTLTDVGLGYIHLGQPAPTLSGGEAQRVKLARELSKRSTGKTMYILDEPTTGLHMEDINKLLLVLNRLVDQGNTVVVIEHNLDVIKTADHVIDLGPEGGDAGGQLVAAGTPEELAMHCKSYTGRFLKPLLGFK
jgi:excinuclease ABC subunit A